MRDLIQFLSENDYATMTEKARVADINRKPISQNQKDAFKRVANLANAHIDGRLIQLSSIGKMMVLAGEDDSNGIFEQLDIAQMGYFIHEEMETLQALRQLKEDADCFAGGEV
jgi:hypothetical protein